MVVSDTEKPTIDEFKTEGVETAVADVDKDISNVEASPDSDPDPQLQTLLNVLEDKESAEESEDEYDSPHSRAARKKKVEADKASIELLGKFVNLTDLLPPLPKKGGFNVEMIKGSQYFFS